MNFASLTLFFIITILTFLLWRRKIKRKNSELLDNYERFKKVPGKKMELIVPNGPRGFPIIGNALQMTDRPHEKMFKWWSEYGPIYKIKLGSQTVVVLNGTSVIREALIDYSEEFAGRPYLYMIHSTLKGKGLISAPYNEEFHEHKKFLLNSFNRYGKRRGSLESNCLQTIHETLESYREKIDHNFEYTNSQMKNSLSQIASQNVLTMTFGSKLHDQPHFSTLIDLVTENFRSTAVAAAFNFLPFTRLFKNFILKNVFRCSDFLNTLISEKMVQIHEEIDNLEFNNNNRASGPPSDINIIEGYLKELLNNTSFFSDSSLDHLQSSSHTQTYNQNSKILTEKRRASITAENFATGASTTKTTVPPASRSRYKSFSFDHLSSLVQDLFVAGTETLSVTLNWTIIYVAYFPECQKLIHEEIERVLGKEKLPADADRIKLPYVEAFINETMRYHCAGPILIPRSTTKDVIFKGYHLPEDTFVMVNMWSCMRDPNYWTDPDKFDPNRFLDKDGKFINKNPAMLPFSTGKRACIGESIARLQLFLIFTSLLQKFYFSFASEEDANNKDLIKGIPGVGLSPPNVSMKLKLK